jgi:hypothetical protein
MKLNGPEASEQISDSCYLPTHFLARENVPIELHASMTTKFTSDYTKAMDIV